MWRGFVALWFVVLSLSGCQAAFLGRTADFKTHWKRDSSSGPSATQVLCDLDRLRTKTELLNRYQVEKFVQTARTISKEITPEEIADLRQLQSDAEMRNLARWDEDRRRNELVGEIYTTALLRAGFKPPETRKMDQTGLSYTVGLDSYSTASSAFVFFLVGHQLKDPDESGCVSQILVGANPGQDRYFVGFSRFIRWDILADGGRAPVYATSSLSDLVEENLPRYCVEAGTALNPDRLNTVEGLPGGARS